MDLSVSVLILSPSDMITFSIEQAGFSYSGCLPRPDGVISKMSGLRYSAIETAPSGARTGRWYVAYLKESRVIIVTCPLKTGYGLIKG